MRQDDATPARRNAPAGLPEIAGVRWARGTPELNRPLSARPVNTGTPISDWIVENRR